MSISIEGLSELFEKFDNIGNTNNYIATIQRLCRKVERTAKVKCPRKTGHLERSITHTVENNGDKVVGIVGTNADYAPYVEFGTGKFAESGNGRKTPWAYVDSETGQIIWTAGQKPQPFLHPALDEHRDEILKELKAAGVKGVTAE